MSKDAADFLKFICLCLGLGLLALAIIESGLPREFAIPFFVVWVIVFLAGVGFISDGMRGAKSLVSRTLLTWAILLSAAALIAWLVLARFG